MRKGEVKSRGLVHKDGHDFCCGVCGQEFKSERNLDGLLSFHAEGSEGRDEVFVGPEDTVEDWRVYGPACPHGSEWSGEPQSLPRPCSADWPRRGRVRTPELHSLVRALPRYQAFEDVPGLWAGDGERAPGLKSGQPKLQNLEVRISQENWKNLARPLIGSD